jgi:4,5-DOPA dioxygenase extradiol
MQPTLYLSHGSPMLALQDHPARHFIAGLGGQLERPDAIVVISAIGKRTFRRSMQ